MDTKNTNMKEASILSITLTLSTAALLKLVGNFITGQIYHICRPGYGLTLKFQKVL